MTAAEAILVGPPAARLDFLPTQSLQAPAPPEHAAAAKLAEPSTLAMGLIGVATLVLFKVAKKQFGSASIAASKAMKREKAKPAKKVAARRRAA